jgi:hypothetical protein
MIRSFFFVFTGALLLGGCAVYSDAELSQLSQRHLAPATMAKLEHRRPLDPDDVIEMHRRGVPDLLINRQLSRAGVDTLIARADALQMRRAGVPPRVIDAAVWASNRFAEAHTLEPDPVLLDGASYGDPWEVHGSLGMGWYGSF